MPTSRAPAQSTALANQCEALFIRLPVISVACTRQNSKSAPARRIHAHTNVPERREARVITGNVADRVAAANLLRDTVAGILDFSAGFRKECFAAADMSQMFQKPGVDFLI